MISSEFLYTAFRWCLDLFWRLYLITDLALRGFVGLTVILLLHDDMSMTPEMPFLASGA